MKRIIKKIIFTILMFSLIPLVNASVVPLARIGDKVYDTLEEAINAVSEDDVITLISNVELDNTLEINKVVNIDLNGNNILAKERVFQIKDGFLTLSGKGTIKETKPNYGAVILIGSSEPTGDKYSSVSVGKDVTLEGWSGIFINHESSKSYGVYAYLEGKIKAIDDVNGGSGSGIYVNGNIKTQEESPVINIMDGAEITSTGNGLYIAGYSTFYIGDAYIEGVESGIGIKSGKLIIDGATVVCNGEDKTPTEGYNNGIKASGTTIQIESNSGYAGKIEIDISRGTFKSKNSNVMYEYIGKGNSSKIYSMSVSGGTFVSEANKEVFSFSNSFKDIHSGFVSGGEYSSDPSLYLKSGYTTVVDNDIFTVTKSTMKGVNSNSISENNSFIKIIITTIIIIVLGILIYINKIKIFRLLKLILNK